MNKHNKTGPVYVAGNAVIIVSTLGVSLLLAWHLLSAGNFMYPLLHDLIGIQVTIEEYASQNRYKSGFDETTREQRATLFRQLVKGINHNGAGLETIRYANASGEPLGLLLRPPEIIHLNDVARLINSFHKAAGIALLALMVMLAIFRLSRLNIPQPRYLLAGTVGVLLPLILAISLWGAKDAFYQWHTLVFPQGHQWFFYYQESLMTMLMKAPDIFAWLAGMLLVLALALYYLLLRLVYVLLGTAGEATTISQVP